MATQPTDPQLLYIAAFAEGERGGIYLYTLDAASGVLTAVGSDHQLDRVLYLRMDAAGRHLYASQVQAEAEGRVAALAVEEAGRTLRLLNTQPSGGRTPCYLDMLDRAGDMLTVANYGSGTVAALPIASDGSVQPASCVIQHEPSERSAEPNNAPHTHSAIVDPTGQWVLVGELGLGELRVYRVDADARTLHDHPAGSAGVHAGAGPRHIGFGQSGKHVYLINEHDATLIVYDWDSTDGTLDRIQQLSTLPEGADVKNHAADLHVHPSGRFVYVSNRGHDSIAVLAVDAETGELRPVQHEPTRGAFPRGFTLDPTGRCLLVGNEHDNTVVTFTIDQTTGRLTATGNWIDIPAPVCFAFARQ